LKLLLDGRFIGYGGGGVFTACCYRELIPMLMEAGHEVTLVLTPKSAAHPDCSALLKIAGVKTIPIATECLTLTHHWRFRKEVKAAADRFFYPHFDMPWLCPYPSVAFIHDIFPVLVPGYTSWLKRRFFDAVCSRTLKRSVAVAVNSQWTKSTIVERYGIAEEKVAIAYPGCDHAVASADMEKRSPFIERWGGREGYLLYVGNAKPHKNLSRLIQAYATLPQELKKRHPFFLVGSRDRYAHKLEREISRLGMDAFVHHLGYQPQETLESLYGGAKALALVSLYEGFGIPPLEAMSHGVPCLVSNTAALAEIYGKAAFAVDPTSKAAIQEGLVRVLSDNGIRAELMERGRTLAGSFTWKRCAETVFNLLI